MKLYNKYSDYLKLKYGEKVYKLPVNIPCTCPNRDGTLGYGGCTFCADVGTGFEMLDNSLSVKEQLNKNMDYISKKYKSGKFIAYFQNYTNTYMDIERFKNYINDAIMDNIVEIAISTRPDCISDEILEFLNEIKKQNVNITIELGLQTVNYHTLKNINRGHTLAEFIDAVLRIKRYNFEICTHIILNLPGDTILDTVETAKILSVLKINQVKIHSLYIMENTEMGRAYKNNEITLISKDEYVERVIVFLEHLDVDITVQRLIGRAPEKDSLFVNWGMSWWKINDDILYKMKSENRYQGSKNKFV
ncbi:MAG: TIGR01212 family radical SAM protein [Tissierellia bacterium]|jgi:radical SAM protein (TIGR01212 family)|nr:TIGR01212 family radical SAM protein [Sedimentibacter sp.]NLA12745.1 TIGR01212 family radical SAM protein [Tissierellia bacterium]HOA18843.1 TIGR01212 family radical SAM protein [Sedimentibacter sp.]HOG62454.1 TIGR01212 family radical SAM protein [Sedimentibacter sp.]HOT22438.1 TIGR01212 family radical SAM protein [Sedimentibacter sp.]